MRVATRRLEGIEGRTDALVGWLETGRAEVVALQGTRVMDVAFPLDPFFERGWYVKLYGREGAEGLALLAVEAPRLVERAEAGGGTEPIPSLLAARIAGVRVVDALAPVQAGPVVHAAWFARLALLVKRLGATGEPVLVLGDLGVPADGSGDEAPRHALGALLQEGLVDVGAPANGDRDTDRVLATPSLARRCADATRDAAGALGVEVWGVEATPRPPWELET